MYRHAGYTYCGKVMAHSYKYITPENMYDNSNNYNIKSFIILPYTKIIIKIIF